MTSRLSPRAATASGIVEVHDGAEGPASSGGAGRRVIPESRRADGSIRKERRIKPGFVPTEDIARFVPSRVQRAREEERIRKQGHSAIKTEAAVQSTASSDAPTSRPSTKTIGTRSEPQSIRGQQSSIMRKKDEDDKKKATGVAEKNQPGTSQTSKVEQSVPDSWDDEDDGDEKDKKVAKAGTPEVESPSSEKTKEGVPSIERVVDDFAKLSLPKSSEKPSS